MEPILRPQDTLYLIKQAPRDGDIILFWQQNELVAHRYFQGMVKGDRNITFDSFHFDQYVGCVLYADGHQGRIYFTQQNLNRFIALCSQYSLIEYGQVCRYLHQGAIFIVATLFRFIEESLHHPK